MAFTMLMLSGLLLAPQRHSSTAAAQWVEDVARAHVNRPEFLFEGEIQNFKKLQDEGDSHDLYENKGSAEKDFGESHDLYVTKGLSLA